MKFAFSTLACPDWNLRTICEKALAFGYAGLEIRAFLNEPWLADSNVFLTDPAKAGEVLREFSVAAACLSTSICFTGRKRPDRQSAESLRHAINSAAAIGAEMVKIFDATIGPGQNAGSVAYDYARWLNPLADLAADRKVTIVIENQLSFRTAHDLWLLHEAIDHSQVGLCWDVLNAALAGEAPAVAIPVLNSRVGLVQVKDAYVGDKGATYCPLGEGDLPLVDLFNRLCGIGYSGWVSFEWEKAWLPGLAGPDQSLPQALAALRELTHPQMESAATP